MTADHDRIELSVELGTDVETVWALVSEPGWFINEGALVDHDVSWAGDTATVTDPDHGTFEFRREAHEPPRHLADRGRVGQGETGRLVEFWVEPDGDGSVLRVVESGFAAMAVPRDEQVAQHEQNTRTWRRQLALVRDRLGT